MKPIGTPLSPHATRVMLLGSGELGKEVLIALQRLGVETIAVDRYEHAPGQQVAHHARTIAMSDPAALRALIEAERPTLVVPEIEAIATPVLQALEAEGVVRVIPTARAARLTMDREGIRRLAAETLGLPTSPYRFCDSLAELQAAIDGGIGYPCIVKPVMSSSGKGQSKIDGPADVGRGLGLRDGRRPRQPRPRDRRGLHRLRLRDHAAHGARDRAPTAASRRTSATRSATCRCSGDYVESWQPHPMHAAGAAARARRSPKAVTDDLGGLRACFGVELFVKGDEVWFSEVSPRPHDTGMVTMTTQWQNEFELHARAILGLPVDISAEEPRRERGDLRRRRGEGHRLRRRGRGAARAGHRPAPVRQAGELRQAPHGRGAGARRRRRARRAPRPSCAASKVQAARGLSASRASAVDRLGTAAGQQVPSAPTRATTPGRHARIIRSCVQSFRNARLQKKHYRVVPEFGLRSFCVR